MIPPQGFTLCARLRVGWPGATVLTHWQSSKVLHCIVRAHTNLRGSEVPLVAHCQCMAAGAVETTPRAVVASLPTHQRRGLTPYHTHTRHTHTHSQRAPCTPARCHLATCSLSMHAYIHVHADIPASATGSGSTGTGSLTELPNTALLDPSPPCQRCPRPCHHRVAGHHCVPLPADAVTLLATLPVPPAPAA